MRMTSITAAALIAAASASTAEAKSSGYQTVPRDLKPSGALVHPNAGNLSGLDQVTPAENSLDQLTPPAPPVVSLDPDLDKFLASSIGPNERDREFLNGNLKLSSQMNDAAEIILRNDLNVNLNNFSPKAQEVLKSFVIAVFSAENSFWSPDPEIRESSFSIAEFAKLIAISGPQALVSDAFERERVRSAMIEIFDPLRGLLQPETANVSVNDMLRLANTGYPSLNHTLDGAAIITADESRLAYKDPVPSMLKGLGNTALAFVIGAGLSLYIAHRRQEMNSKRKS